MDEAISTALAGAQQAQALQQATVNAAVLTAMPAAPTPGPTVEYVNLYADLLVCHSSRRSSRELYPLRSRLKGNYRHCEEWHTMPQRSNL